MKFRRLPGVTAMLVASVVTSCANTQTADQVGQYVDWGVDEYEFFGAIDGLAGAGAR